MRALLGSVRRLLGEAVLALVAGGFVLLLGLLAPVAVALAWEVLGS